MTDTLRPDRPGRADTTGIGAASTTGTSRWLLIVSLALNLLLVGALLGGMLLDRGRRHGGGPEGVRGGLTAFVSTLPADRREALWEATRKQWGELRQMRKEARKARQAVDEALAAEPFDKAKLIAAQAQVAESEARIHGPTRALFADIAASMTAAERRAFLKAKEHTHRRRPIWPPAEEGEAKPGK